MKTKVGIYHISPIPSRTDRDCLTENIVAITKTTTYSSFIFSFVGLSSIFGHFVSELCLFSFRAKVALARKESTLTL